MYPHTPKSPNLPVCNIQLPLFMYSVIKFTFQDCTDAGGVCRILIDGYYVESIICVVLGILWLRWKGQQTRSLQDLPESVWRYQ